MAFKPIYLYVYSLYKYLSLFVEEPVQEILINQRHCLTVMDRIPLDQPTLKALAGETRVKILKLLDRKADTQTGIAAALKMSMPTVGEHLKALEHAELVEREQTERKWKYYSLTQKARMLLHPNTTTIWFILGLFLFSAAATVLSAINFFTPAEQFGAPTAAKMMVAEESADAAASLMQAAPEALAAVAPELAPAPSPVWLTVFGIATVVFLIALIALLRRYGWLGNSLTNKKNI